MDPRLARLRIELYTAIQTLQDEDLLEFLTLLDELHVIRQTQFPHIVTKVE